MADTRAGNPPTGLKKGSNGIYMTTKGGKGTTDLYTDNDNVADMQEAGTRDSDDKK